ncbi:MAG TPA: outer membrane beta-barrel protein [Pelomicrobium sp.]|nr:outer membrane beta-barrel protein [Pelomicrobium sp.]
MTKQRWPMRPIVLILGCLWAGFAGAQAPSGAIESVESGVEQRDDRLPVVVPSDSPSRRVTEPRTAPPQQRGPYRAGSYLVYPELTLTGFYDSNVFYANTPRLDDEAAVISPALWLVSDWDKHALNFHGSADFTKYGTYDSEDTTDWRVSAEGRRDFSIDSNVYGGIRYARDHEDRESPDFRNGITPTRYMAARAYGGYFQQIERWSVRFAGTALNLDYEDVPFVTGSGAVALINNDDRDRWQYTGGVRVGYEVSPRLEPFVQASLDDRRYDDVPDDLGFYRDSDGWRALVGVRYNLPRQLKAEAYVGYLNQQYDDARFADVSKPAFGGTLQWQATDKLRVSGYVDRTVEETTVIQVTPVLAAASSYLNTYVGVGADYRLLNNLTLQATASYSNADYQGIERDDDYWSGGVGVVWRVDRQLFVDFSYLHRNLDSSVPGEDFDKNQFFVRLTMPFQN